MFCHVHVVCGRELVDNHGCKWSASGDSFWGGEIIVAKGQN